MSSKEITLEINYTPHAGQLEVLEGMKSRPWDIATIVASRGWGKTIFVNNSLVIPYLNYFTGSKCLWVAPTYKICKTPVEDVWKGVDEDTGKRYIPQYTDDGKLQFWEFKSGDMELSLINSSKIDFRSAENGNSIVSRGYNIIIIDEAALIDKQTFMMQILPTARRKNVKIILISTPRGKNWFYEMYQAGQDLSQKSYISFKQPWYKRPNYPAVLQRLMKEMPEHLRRQEFEAEFLADGSGVFKNLDKIFTGTPIQFSSDSQEWSIISTLGGRFQDELFVVSVDFAKSHDYTVITAISQQKKDLVYYCRMNKTDYKVVLEKVKRVSQALDNADVIYDATGVGGGLTDFFSRDVNAYPFVWTHQSKNDIINKLIVATEYGELHCPNLVTLKNEFEIFEYEVSRAGKILYHAPDGKFDDCVASIAMANWYADEHSVNLDGTNLDEELDAIAHASRPKSDLERLFDEDD